MISGEQRLRQMVLTEIAGADGELPAALAPAWETVSAEQRRRTAEVLHAWRSDASLRAGYGELARQVDEALGLRRALPWSDRLATCAVTPATEEVAFDEAVRRLGEGDPSGAASLASQRLERSPWVQPQGPAGDRWAALAARWRAVHATAELRLAIAAAPVPTSSGPGELLRWYVDSGW